MPVRWFVPMGWLHRPVSAVGWLFTLAALAFTVQVFIAVDARSHSVSDTLYGIFPFWGVTWLAWDWIARRSARPPGSRNPRRGVVAGRRRCADPSTCGLRMTTGACAPRIPIRYVTVSAPGVALAQRVAFASGVTLSAAKGLSCRETSFLGVRSLRPDPSTCGLRMTTGAGAPRIPIRCLTVALPESPWRNACSLLRLSPCCSEWPLLWVSPWRNACSLLRVSPCCSEWSLLWVSP